MTTHKIKCYPKHFSAIVSGIKSFEVRRNDRNYNVGDCLVILEFDPNANNFHGKETGANCSRYVTYVLHPKDIPGEPLHEDFVILGLKERT